MSDLQKKLNEIQSELKVPKSQFNKFGGFNYRSCEDILETVKPLLKSKGLTLLISDEIIPVNERVYVKATATLSDGETCVSTSAAAREPLQKKGMDDSQITGCASSYARKYALNGLFAIDDAKDADTEEGERRPAQTSERRPAQTNAAPSRSLKKYDAEKFKTNLPQWGAVVASGKQTALGMIDKLREMAKKNGEAFTAEQVEEMKKTFFALEDVPM